MAEAVRMLPAERFVLVHKDGELCGSVLWDTEAEANGSLGAECFRVARVTITEGDGWDGIESAPEDKYVFVWSPEHEDTVEAILTHEDDAEEGDDRMWFVVYDGEGHAMRQDPTHWRLKPAPPAAGGKGK